MKRIKYFSAVMAMAVCSALALTSCEKENFDVNSQSQGSSSSSTQEIVIPQNDAKLVVAVSVIDISTFKDINDATVKMDGENFSGQKTWTGSSIESKTLNFTADASGYYTSEKKVVTPAVNKGEFVYIPVTIYLRAQDTQEPYIEPGSAEEPLEGQGQEGSETKPDNLADILNQAETASEPFTVQLTTKVPTGLNLLEKEEGENFEAAVNCITWEEPFVDYTKMFPDEPETKGLIETTLKNVRDKLLAWAKNSEWSYKEVTVEVTVPAKTIDIDVNITTVYRKFHADVVIKTDVEGEEKEFGVRKALFGEVSSNDVAITAKVEGEEEPEPIYHGHGTDGSGGAGGE
ncbi:MAG: DUF3869 domain-containing protein [Bacteroidales bacterium]|nr:DUF3869 domain-containing protein [Bacteroidales bacterium]